MYQKRWLLGVVETWHETLNTDHTVIRCSDYKGSAADGHSYGSIE
jgi:hypothetical protein